MLYFDLELRLLVTRPGYASPLTSLRFKRGDLQTMEVQYCRGATLVELTGAEPVIRWGIKETLSGALLALADTWTNVDGVYKAPFSTNTEELLANLGNSVSKKYLGELTFTDDAGGPTSSQTIAVTIENDVNKEEDTTPVPLPGPVDWLAAHGIVFDPAITVLTGGGAGKLDGVAVTGANAGQLRAVRIASTVYLYVLTAADLPENSPATINVDGDPDALSWVLQSSRVANLIAAGVNADSVTATSHVEIGGAEDGRIDLLAQDGENTRTASLSATGLTGDRAHKVPDRDGVLVPFIDIEENTTDNAGLRLVDGVISLVLRHQTNNTWHTFTMVDSDETPGTPTYEFSAPLVP